MFMETCRACNRTITGFKYRAISKFAKKMGFNSSDRHICYLCRGKLLKGQKWLKNKARAEGWLPTLWK